MTTYIAAVDPTATAAGDTAWLLASAALVLLMAPGLAIFYGGMVRSKSVLNMMMMVMGALAVVTVVWVLIGYSIAFGDDVRRRAVRRPDAVLRARRRSCAEASPDGGMPEHRCSRSSRVSSRSITVGADRRRDRRPHPVRRPGWSSAPSGRSCVYAPVAHWIFDFSADGHVGGWMANELGALDFAGGTAVEINSGAAGLAAALVLGHAHRLRPRGDEAAQPDRWSCSAPACCGSAGSASTPARRSAPTTSPRSPSSTRCWPAAPACWPGSLVERIRDGHATSFGAASGVGRRPGRDHAVVRLGDADGCDGDRRRRRRDLRVGRRPEVQARVRRLARRRRRPPGRRPGRHHR